MEMLYTWIVMKIRTSRLLWGELAFQFQRTIKWKWFKESRCSSINLAELTFLWNRRSWVFLRSSLFFFLQLFYADVFLVDVRQRTRIRMIEFIAGDHWTKSSGNRRWIYSQQEISLHLRLNRFSVWPLAFEIWNAFEIHRQWTLKCLVFLQYGVNLAIQSTKLKYNTKAKLNIKTLSNGKLCVLLGSFVSKKRSRSCFKACVTQTAVFLHRRTVRIAYLIEEEAKVIIDGIFRKVRRCCLALRSR